jgi:hypothetical protein
MIVEFVGSGMDLIYFQFTSPLAYIATIEEVSKTTYYTDLANLYSRVLWITQILYFMTDI